jgi:hypothetical protein
VRSISMLGVAAAAALIVLVQVGTGGQTSGVRNLVAARAGQASAGSSSAGSQSTGASGVSALAQARHSRARNAPPLLTSQRSAHPRARRHASRPEQHAAHQPAHARTSTGTVQRVRYTSSTGPSDRDYSASSSSPASATPGPTATVSSGTGLTPGSGNQPALGANGALAPGSSPDG